LRKSVITVTSAALLLTGLTGCGTGDNAAGNRQYEETSPIGYYTSENNPYVNNGRNRQVNQDRGNTYRLNDNDGPLNEVLDRSVIYNERIRNNRNTTYNMNNRNNTTRTAPLSTGNRGGIFGNNGTNFSRSDMNYHGHLNGVQRATYSSYYNNYHGRLTEKLAERASKVEGVEDVRAVVYGNDILVAVEPEKNANGEKVTKDVRRAIEPLAGDKNTRVVVDQSTFTRVRQADNDLRNGGPVDRVNQDMRSLMQSVGPGR
jgi:spore cortex protein